MKIRVSTEQMLGQPVHPQGISQELCFHVCSLLLLLPSHLLPTPSTRRQRGLCWRSRQRALLLWSEPELCAVSSQQSCPQAHPQLLGSLNQRGAAPTAQAARRDPGKGWEGRGAQSSRAGI